ncbi:MAG: sugar phosphate isomerase/epimerase, partial [Proteobacteria bacterium]|nr:sugar phosphate isomerase/epimerase [Pseudomonadota bacterium]
MPGAGGLPLWRLIETLPANIPYGVEVPLAAQFPDLDPGARLKRLVAATRDFLQRRPA